MNEFERCLEEGRIMKIKTSKGLIRKEIDAAEDDLRWTKKSMIDGNYKWASVQAYYSMFHAAKALLFSKGYREKSHYCLLVAIRELFVATGEMASELADSLEECMDIRHEADYGLIYDEESAGAAVKRAEVFLATARRLLHI